MVRTMKPMFQKGEVVRIKESVPGKTAGRKAVVLSVIPIDREAGRFGYAVETTYGFHRARVAESAIERIAAAGKART